MKDVYEVEASLSSREGKNSRSLFTIHLAFRQCERDTVYYRQGSSKQQSDIKVRILSGNRNTPGIFLATAKFGRIILTTSYGKRN